MSLFSRRFLVIIWGILILNNGCASISNYKTAKPLGKGNFEAIVSTSFSQHAFKNIDISSDAYLRVGISEKIDLGFKYTVPYCFILDAKYCFFGAEKDSGIIIACGLQGGYANLSLKNIGEFFSYSVPLYFSFYSSGIFSFTLIPSYNGRVWFGSKYEHLVGTNINIRIGRKFGLISEAALYQSLTYGSNDFMFGAGLFIDF